MIENSERLRRPNCPTRQILDRVGDKWAVLILLLLRDEPMRFNALRRTIEGISQKMLSQVLKSLERDGLIKRRAIATVPVTVEYSITPLGATLADRRRSLARLGRAEFEGRADRPAPLRRAAQGYRSVSTPRSHATALS